MGSTKPNGSRPGGAKHAAAVAYMEYYIAEHEGGNAIQAALSTCKDFYSTGNDIDTANNAFDTLDAWHTTTESANNYGESVEHIDVIWLGINGA